MRRNERAYPRSRPEHFRVSRAVKRGDLTRLPCEVCAAPITEGHHDDYGKPLEVRWLCRAHHSQQHGRDRDPATWRWRIAGAAIAPQFLVVRQTLEGLTARAMATRIGLSEQNWCHVRKNRRDLSATALERACAFYPDLHARISQAVEA